MLVIYPAPSTSAPTRPPASQWSRLTHRGRCGQMANNAAVILADWNRRFPPHIYLSIYLSIYLYIYIYVCVCMCLYVYVCHVCMCMYVYIYIYICVCVALCVWTIWKDVKLLTCLMMCFNGFPIWHCLFGFFMWFSNKSRGARPSVTTLPNEAMSLKGKQLGTPSCVPADSF